MDKFQQFASGGIYGILSISFALIGDILAYLFFPGYDFTKRAVSYLCEGPGGIFFQVGTVFSGIFAILFVIYIGGTFSENQINEKESKTAVFFALISCVSLIILGVFCGSNKVISLIHGVSAVISWISGICYITLFNILMLKDLKYSKFLAYIGFSVSISLSTMVIMFFLYYIPGLQNLVIILPLWEWINTFAMIFWYSAVSSYLLIKKI